MKATDQQKVIAVLQYTLVFILLVYAGWLSAHAAWYLLYPAAGQPMAISSATAVSGGGRGEIRHPIAQMDLFGRVGAPVKSESKALVEQAEKTTLRLKLKGVFMAEQESESGAIVEEVGKQADYYRVGASLPGNALLEQVFPDKILMRRNGRLESLSFDAEDGGPAVSRVTSTAKPQKQTVKTAEPKVETPEQFMEEATRQLAEDPEKALSSVGLVPGSDGGYVYSGDNPMLSGLNLKKGDVIKSVNGHSLGDIKKDKALMQTLYEQGTLEVEVVRDGTSFFVNYPLR